MRSNKIEDRLWGRVVEMPSGCREWGGSTNHNGYGRILFQGKNAMTHRVAWTLKRGPIPPGLYVLHHCDNPPCTQTEPTEGYPDGHLFLGTQKENAADRESKGRHASQKKTHCLQKHEYTPENTHIRPSGARECISCRPFYQKRFYANKRRQEALSIF